jgi:hypothetical protein
LIHPDALSKVYPDECSLALANNGYGKGLVVPRDQLIPIDGAAWSPQQRAEFAGTYGNSMGAFGPEFVTSHNQAEGRAATPPYTEYIELGFETAVYLNAIEVGSPRGMGQVAAVKVRVDGQWVPVYRDGPKLGQGREYATTRQFWRFAPTCCRPHSLVSEVRVEVDTSAATGIAVPSAQVGPVQLPSSAFDTLSDACACACHHTGLELSGLRADDWLSRQAAGPAANRAAMALVRAASRCAGRRLV